VPAQAQSIGSDPQQLALGAQPLEEQHWPEIAEPAHF
jgi:hypothetical protein